MQWAMDYYIERELVGGGLTAADVENFKREAPRMGFTPRQADLLARWAVAWHSPEAR